MTSHQSASLPITLLFAGLLTLLAGCWDSAKSVGPGETWVVDRTVQLRSLTIAEGAVVEAPDGYSLTLTVDGVEQDLRAGTYSGVVVVTCAVANPVEFVMMGPEDPMIHPFRQAIYLDESGLVKDKSVLAAARGYRLEGNVLSDADIQSSGENFNGIYVAGGSYTLSNVMLYLDGPGGNDFAGWGAGIMSSGDDVVLRVDRADVRARGVVRTALVADKGSKLIVTDSHIETRDGVQPADYQPNTTPGRMRDVPWMLGLSGNCRATNLLGDGTVAAYINSSVAAERWGVLSIDNGRNTRLYAVNTHVAITGDSGYGTYSIGDAINTFLGSTINVADYGAIVTGGNVVFASSSAERVDQMNAEAGLGLTAADLAAIEPRETTVNSQRFGVMVWGNDGSQTNTVKVLDGTVFQTGEAFLIDRGAPAVIDVDGSGGAAIDSRNGVILQLMDLDKAPGVRRDGLNLTTGVYSEPPLLIAKVADFDLTAAHTSDVTARFANIALTGDFYNGISTSKNLLLDFDKTQITGVITATVARHAKSTLTSADWQLVSEVANTPAPAVNNGVVVSLRDSVWMVTGTSYLTSITLDEASEVVSASGGKLSMTVDGNLTPIGAGSYQGDIVLTIH